VRFVLVDLKAASLAIAADRVRVCARKRGLVERAAAVTRFLREPCDAAPLSLSTSCECATSSSSHPRR
jgi:hypothetical protein